MTDHNEKLIEEAARAIDGDAWLRADDFRSVFGRPFGLTEQQDRKVVARAKALAVLDVLEKAHTPTGHAKESDTSTERVNNGADSSHVTPTDDERADAEQRWPIPLNYEAGDSEHTLLIAQRQAYMLGRSDARTRSEVPEPSRIGCNVCGEALPDGEPHLCAEPQGEPSDAQVDAAIRGFHESTFGTVDDGFLTPDRLARMRDPWRAALRAAATAGGEPRG